MALHYSTRLGVFVLGLDKVREEQPRSVASYRAERSQRQAQKAREIVAMGGVQTRFDRIPAAEYIDGTKGGTKSPLSPVSKRGLLSTTIFEEDDSSDIDFG
ncbi:hypothetical protein MMC10_007951 [Thelotrema lepadinum]|nr:hypothetical protein [Thelotrema lepadinum]